jgi:hypothetical protein
VCAGSGWVWYDDYVEAVRVVATFYSEREVTGTGISRMRRRCDLVGGVAFRFGCLCASGRMLE